MNKKEGEKKFNTCCYFEKFGRCDRNLCKLVHRRVMGLDMNKTKPESRKVCLNFLYDNNCKAFLQNRRCSDMHINNRAHSKMLNDFNYEDFGYKRRKTEDHDPPRIPCKLLNRTIGCVNDNCRLIHKPILNEAKRVIVLIGERGSGCSTLGNVILWSGTDFREEPVCGNNPFLFERDKEFRVGWDDRFVVVSCASIESMANAKGMERFNIMIQHCEEKYNGIDFFVYVTRTGIFEVRTSILRQVEGILGEDQIRSRFLIVRTHFEKYYDGGSVKREKLRVLDNISNMIPICKKMSTDQVMVVDNTPKHLERHPPSNIPYRSLSEFGSRKNPKNFRGASRGFCRDRMLEYTLSEKVPLGRISLVKKAVEFSEM